MNSYVRLDMVTLGEKVVALTVVVLIDATMLAVGGVVFAAAAVLASMPFSVAIATR